ncbi:uncharacterized protein LOC143294353 [Babylonia areolata]|uniref:uncharacterized protein LOC143294353 n=1 Tax=Babylonia areolata TaxID=304850 RepID=UPI003FD6476C
MEAEPKEKGQRRKLKRVVQKKKKSKVNLNNSASVVYYKKVKAALNASLNTSRASQTLKANNKALAQSLQHVKQELRWALNENGRLKVENQELTMKLLRLENQVCSAPDQVSYEERLQGLKAVLNNISRHLLNVGNCINDGMDLCLVSPRTSQASSSRPQSMEEFKVTEPEEPNTSGPLPASELNGMTRECEADVVPLDDVDQWEGEMYGDSSNQNSLGKMMPDMSIIMEQSVLVDPDEGPAPPNTHMTAVPEDPDASRSELDSKNGSKKLSALTKLPQRVRNGGSSKNSCSEKDAGSPKFGLKMKRSGSRQQVEKAANRNAAGKSSASKSPPCPRRETFVVSKDVEKDTDTFSTGSIEDISSIPMPDLVSGSPMKDEQAREVFEPDTIDYSEPNIPKDVQDNNLPAKSPREETSNQSKQTVESAGSSSDTSSREKRKSAGKKTELATTKHAKGSAVKANRVITPSKKETELFILNPCALNLAYKKATGSDEGCVDAAKQSQAPLEPESSLDQFMAHIRESNRNSSKLASFLVIDDLTATEKSSKSTDIPANVHKSPRRSSGGSFEPQSEDQTVYFDTDMEFTEVLPQSQNLVAVVEENVTAETTHGRKDETKSQQRSRRKGATRKEDSQKTGSSKPGQKTVSSKKEIAEKEGEDGDSEKGGSDKKLAVALRVNKPGQMVFAASRKEDDGSRKAIPAKLQTKARSKSKKQVEEMARNLPQKEPECVFDFHDKTPRPSAAEAKSGQQHGSVFDLSLNDTVPGIVSSLASIREKLKVIDNTSGEEREAAGSMGKKKTAPSVLLGDAPAYLVPLKDDSSETESRPRSRGGSSTRNNESGRQSRSRSRSRREEKDGENVQPATASRPSRSRSRRRKISETADDESNKVDVSNSENSESDASNRRKSGATAEVADENALEKPRRSARSRSRVHTRYTEEDAVLDSVSSSVSSPNEKSTGGGRSRSRVKKDDDDEDYRPSVKAQPRGRSRRRQADDHPTASDTAQEKPAQLRGRSRSRRRVQEDKSSLQDNETQADTKATHQDSRQELNSTSSEKAEGLQDMKAGKQNSEKELGSVESDQSDGETLKMITDRRQRSKSISKKLYNEAHMSNDPFGFSANVDKMVPDSQPVSVLARQEKRPARSKSTAGLSNQEETNEQKLKDSSEGPQESDITTSCPPESSSSKLQDGTADKRKMTTGQCESERNVSPTKKLRKDKKSFHGSEKAGEKSTEMTENAKDKVPEKLGMDSSNGTNSAAVTKKRKSSLPIAVFHKGEEEDKSQDSPATSKPKGKPVSKLPETKPAEKIEKTKYQLEFEDMKRKLKELDNSGDSTTSAFAAKKSRPLVLPTHSTAAVPGSKKLSAKSLPNTDTEQLANSKKTAPRSKKGRSQPGSPKSKKEASRLQPGSPVPKAATSPASSAALSPQLPDHRSSQGRLEEMDENSQSDGKRVGRRAAASVCYKEPSLSSKLRRGDPHTTFLHKDHMTHIYKSPKTQRKSGKSERVDRSALHDLTNMSIIEVDSE